MNDRSGDGTGSLEVKIRTNMMIIVRCPISPQRGTQKRKTAVFRVKSHFAWRKSATKFLCVKAVSDNVVRHSLAQLFLQKW